VSYARLNEKKNCDQCLIRKKENTQYGYGEIFVKNNLFAKF